MIFDKVVKLIEAQMTVDTESVSMDTRLFEDLNADSANVMMLVMDLEQEFDLTVEDEMFANIKTVGDIVRYLEENLSK